MPILDLDSISDKDSKPITLAELRRRLKEHPNDPHLKKLNKELAESLSHVTQNLNSALISNVQGVLVSYNHNAMATLGAAMKPNPAMAYLISEALHPTFAQLVSEMAESQRRLLETFKMPNYLFESLRTLSDQVNNQLFESIKLLSQSFAMYQTPHLFNELTKINTSWLVPGYIVTEEEIISPKEYEQELEKERKIFTSELVILEENKFEIENLPYYYYEGSKTLFFKVTTLAAITLYTKDDTSDIELFVTTLLGFLEEAGEVVGEFKRVFVPIQDLMARLIKTGKKNVDMNWIKYTRSNFINHKVPKFLKDVVKISDFDRNKKGYYFEIRVAIPMPKLLT